MTRQDIVSSFEYLSGELIWRERPLDAFANKKAWATWNGKMAGEVAGSAHIKGYVSISFMGKRHLAHRLVYSYFNDDLHDTDQIDHINGVKNDNRIENLRKIDNKRNHQNIAKPSHNTSGVKGVSLDKRSGKWVAYIGYNGKRKQIGLFTTKGLAAVARAKADLIYHGRYANICGKPMAR